MGCDAEPRVGMPRTLEVPMRCFFLSSFLGALALGSVAQTQLLGDTPLATTPPNFTAQNHSAPPGGLWADGSGPIADQCLVAKPGPWRVVALPSTPCHTWCRPMPMASVLGCPARWLTRTTSSRPTPKTSASGRHRAGPQDGDGPRPLARQPGVGQRFGVDAHRPRPRTGLHDDALQRPDAAHRNGACHHGAEWRLGLSGGDGQPV